MLSMAFKYILKHHTQYTKLLLGQAFREQSFCFGLVVFYLYFLWLQVIPQLGFYYPFFNDDDVCQNIIKEHKVTVE